jgi:F-type H+-transporting ATPase subunit c
VSKRSAVTFAFMLVAGFAAPLYAQGAGESALNVEIAKWSIITAGFALGIGAGLAALGQGRAVAAAAEGIARNPGAAGDIRGVLLLGLVLIESLAIYVFVISLILFFLQPFSPASAG